MDQKLKPNIDVQLFKMAFSIYGYKNEKKK